MKKKKSTFNQQERDGINVTHLKHTVRKNYRWFLFAGLLGLIAAFSYSNLIMAKYNTATTLMFKADNSQATLTSVHQDIQDGKKEMTVQNQAAVLTSYTLNLQTLQNLGWNIDWYKTTFIKKKDLYKQAPYQLKVINQVPLLNGVNLHITQVDGQRFAIKCDEEVEVNGEKLQIAFSDTGKFGQEFRNRYCSFTLRQLPGNFVKNGDSFLLRFNDLGRLTKSYQENLKVNAGEDGSGLITIELTSKNPQRAIDYLNELDSIYIKYGLLEKNKRAANTVRFIDKQIAGIADSLQNNGDNFSNYRTDNSIIDIGQQSASVVSNLDKIEGDITVAKMQEYYFRNLRNHLNDPSKLKNMSVPPMNGVNDAPITDLITRLNSLYQQRQTLSQTAQEQSPQMITLNEDISLAKRSLIENVNNLLENAQHQLQSLNDQKRSINSVKASIPKTEQKLGKIKRTLDFNNELYVYLLQKKSEAQIALASRDPDAHIIDAASLGTTERKGFPPAINLGIGFLSGLILVLIFLTGKSLFKGKLNYVSDITDQLRPSIVGSILFNKFNDELPVLSYPHSAITESFRNLRINLHYLLGSLDNKVISVHSSIAGEGKTFVSANLAAIIAINNKTVLLVDADLRQPRTHRIFKCQNEIGLSNYLKGEESFNQIVLPTEIKGLDLVTSGPQPDYPSELLGTNHLINFIAEAKKHYEYIIFNNAPLNIVKDAMMVAPFCDANLFLLRMKKSSSFELSYINQLLSEGFIKNVAVALNNISAGSYAISEQQSHGYYNDDRMLTIKQ